MEEMEVNHVDDIHEKLTDMVAIASRLRPTWAVPASSSAWAPSRASTRPSSLSRLTSVRGRKSRQSYQYIDVLTGQVELFDPESGEHIFTPLGNQLEEH